MDDRAKAEEGTGDGPMAGEYRQYVAGVIACELRQKRPGTAAPLAANEGHLRGTVDADAAHLKAAKVQDLGLPYELALGNRAAMTMTAVRWAAEHRLVRLGAVLALASRQHARAPNSEAEAREWMGDHAALMDAGTWDVALRYERLGPKRFRLAVDPKSTVPTILKGTNEATHAVQSPLGDPASQLTLRARQGGFEFQIP